MRSAILRPRRAVEVAFALARGWWYRLWYGVRRSRFSAGRNLRVFGRIVLRGPGRFSVGDDVVIYGRLTPWTHTPQAHIRVGNMTSLDGVRFGCADSISIGNRCIIASCEILDTDFHSTHADRHNPRAPVRVEPVVVEDNVWVAAQAALLPGTRIGSNSVVGYGAICVQRYPENSVLFGNPARKVAPVLGAVDERGA